MKISEKELKQIVVEALQEEDLDEGIMDKIKGVAGGLKGVGGAAKAAASDAAGAVKGAYGKGSYSSTKKSVLDKVQTDLEKLKDAADKYDEDENFSKAIGSALDAIGSIVPNKVATPALDRVPKDARLAAIAKRRAAAAEAGEAPEAADAPAAAEEPAAAEAKPQINVFRGRGGKGVQSMMAKAGVQGKDMSRILKGLKSDLADAGFEVLEELAEANRKEISLEKTLKAIEQIADPGQKEAAKKIIVKLLKKNKVKVSDARLRKAEPAAPASTPTNTNEVETLSESQVSRFAKIAGLL